MIDLIKNAIPILTAGAGSLLNHQANQETKKSNEAIAGANQEMQKEFAQNGVRWKVEDAKRAGIHPLAALGANTMSFSPVSVGNTPDTSLGDGLNQMGQNLTRAVSSTMTQQEKQMNQLNLATAQANLDGKIIENQYKAGLLATQGQKPAFPGSEYTLPGQGQSGTINNKPLDRTYTRPGAPHQEVGSVADVGYGRTSTGLVPVPSTDMKQKIEDNLIQEVLWSVRNNLVPNITGGTPPSNEKAPPGQKWQWHYPSQEYRLQSEKDPTNRWGKSWNQW